MAFLRLLVIFLVINNCTSGSLEENEDIVEVPDLKAASPFFDVTRLCLQRNIINARSRKIICLICKGFDPSCFTNTNNTSPSTTENTTTTTSSTTVITTSTPKSTTTEAPPAE